jgi:hypothetical protein
MCFNTIVGSIWRLRRGSFLIEIAKSREIRRCDSGAVTTQHLGVLCYSGAG